MNNLTSRAFEDLAQHDFLRYSPTICQYVAPGSSREDHGLLLFRENPFPFFCRDCLLQLSLIFTVGKYLLPILNSRCSVYLSYGLVLVAQLCLILCNPMDCSPPSSSVHGILQARLLGWVVIPFSRGSSQPRDQTQVSYITGRFFTV